jgi:hypothetical protein
MRGAGLATLAGAAVLAGGVALAGCDSCKKPPPIDVPGAGPDASESAGPVIPLDASVPSFEGSIEVTSSEKGRASERITYRYKGDRVRVDGRDKDVYIVQSLARPVTRIVTLSEKQYFEVDFASALADASFSADAGATSAVVKRTGATRAIAGYQCEVWEMTDDKRRAAACVTPVLAAALPQAPHKGEQASAWTVAFDAAKVYPLFLDSLDDEGKPELKSHVVKIERQALDDKLFEVPAGFTRIGATTTTLDGGFGR